jgi:hypothetical protein
MTFNAIGALVVTKSLGDNAYVAVFLTACESIMSKRVHFDFFYVGSDLSMQCCQDALKYLIRAPLFVVPENRGIRR